MQGTAGNRLSKSGTSQTQAEKSIHTIYTHHRLQKGV